MVLDVPAGIVADPDPGSHPAENWELSPAERQREAIETFQPARQPPPAIEAAIIQLEFRNLNSRVYLRSGWV